MWIGLSVFLYGAYTCFGVNETRATMGQYADNSILDAMGDRGLMWIGIGVLIVLIGAVTGFGQGI